LLSILSQPTNTPSSLEMLMAQKILSIKKKKKILGEENRNSELREKQMKKILSIRNFISQTTINSIFIASTTQDSEIFNKVTK